MKKDPKVYCEDILESINDIFDYTRGDNFHKFLNSKKTQDAVVRRLEIIGEAGKRIPHDIKTKNPQIPWKDIMGMRDIIAHDYDTVNLEKIWDVIENDLSPLEKQIRLILESLSPEGRG